MEVGKLDELEAFERRRQILNFGGMTANLGRTDSLRNTRRCQNPPLPQQCPAQCGGLSARRNASFLRTVRPVR